MRNFLSSQIYYITEMQARKEIDERNKIQDSIKMVDTVKKEQELRNAAKEARQKKMALAVSNISSVNTAKTDESDLLIGNKRVMNNDELEAAKNERNNLRNQRKKEIERGFVNLLINLNTRTLPCKQHRFGKEAVGIGQVFFKPFPLFF